MFDFDGKCAVVTGASGALGAVVVRRLLDAGAHVARVDRERQAATISPATSRTPKGSSG